MSSGCAPIAKAAGARVAAGTGLPARRATGSMAAMRVPIRGAVGSENHFVSAHRVFEAGERHVLIPVERSEKCLKLPLIRVVGDVAGIEQLHGELTPTAFVEATEMRRVDLV